MIPPQVLSSVSYLHDLAGQDEWDEDTKLFQPYEVEQILMPDMSNCLSVQAFLKIAKLPFSVEYRANAEYMSPTGKVPFIKSGQFVIGDLECIINYAQSKGVSLTEELDDLQKSDMRAYMSLVNTVLGNAETYIVWCDNATLPITQRRYGFVFPFPLNHILTYFKKQSAQSRLRAVGWLSKDLNKVYADVDLCCRSLSDRLGSSDYFFNKPTELDAVVFGHVFTILTTALPTNRFAATVRSYSNLIEHCTRIEKLYFNFSRPAVA